MAASASVPMTTLFVQLAQWPSGPIVPPDPEALAAIIAKARARGRKVQRYLAARTWIASH